MLVITSTRSILLFTILLLSAASSIVAEELPTMPPSLYPVPQLTLGEGLDEQLEIRRKAGYRVRGKTRYSYPYDEQHIDSLFYGTIGYRYRSSSALAILIFKEPYSGVLSEIAMMESVSNEFVSKNLNNFIAECLKYYGTSFQLVDRERFGASGGSIISVLHWRFGECSFAELEFASESQKRALHKQFVEQYDAEPGHYPGFRLRIVLNCEWTDKLDMTPSKQFTLENTGVGAIIDSLFEDSE